jgi:hypothetical protein
MIADFSPPLVTCAAENPYDPALRQCPGIAAVSQQPSPVELIQESAVKPDA